MWYSMFMVESIDGSDEAIESLNGRLWDAQDRIYFGDDAVDKEGFQHDCTKYIVAKDDEVIVGVLQLNITNGVGEVHSVIVEPEHRGEGVGKRLFTELDKIARSEGLHYVWLETREDWSEATSLYEAFGYKLTQRLPVYCYGLEWIRMGKQL